MTTSGKGLTWMAEEPVYARPPFWRSPFFRNRLALVSGVLIILIVIAGILAPFIAPHDPNDQDLTRSLQGASSEFPLGTDKQGRDILSRIIYGTRTALLSALMVVILSELIGVPLGLIAGYYGGFIDNLIMRAWDILLSFPPLLLVILIVATFGRGLSSAVVALAIVYVPMISRVVRGAALVERELDYVEAARAIGYPDMRIIFRHILPNCLSPILVQSTIDLAYAILDIAALSFLGLGVQPPTPDWGSMLSDGLSYLFLAPNVSLAAGFSIMVAVIAFNLFGDGLRAQFDPRQREI
ncbi:MAG: ABC transporter permease [Anaerolineae bacterium]